MPPAADSTSVAPAFPARAARAASRSAATAFVLGGLGAGASLFVIARLLETWRVGPGPAAHRVTIAGQQLSYPAANAGAVVVLVLASAGLVVISLAVLAAVREVLGAIRLERRLARARIGAVGSAIVIDDGVPRAFCAGLVRPTVYVSTAAVGSLDPVALEAVLEHERHHALRRDPLRFATGRVIASALFFVPALGQLAERHRTLAELGADEAATANSAAGRSAVARAMLAFLSSDGAGVDAERVDHLLGQAPRWRFPTLLAAGVAAVAGLVCAVGVLAGRVASGSATLALPFVSRQPCVVVLAMVPLSIALLSSHILLRRRADG